MSELHDDEYAAEMERDPESVRYRIYAVGTISRHAERRAKSERVFGHPGANIPTIRDGRGRRCLCATSKDGIGTALVDLREHGEITNDTRVGIRDAVERTWIVNPWAKGDA